MIRRKLHHNNQLKINNKSSNAITQSNHINYITDLSYRIFSAGNAVLFRPAITGPDTDTAIISSPRSQHT